MKTVAYISDFLQKTEDEKTEIEKIRQNTQANRIIGIMNGNYLPNGLPAEEKKEIRRQRAFTYGIDAVVELPIFSSISSIGIYAFGIIRTLDKMSCVDEVVLMTEGTSGEFLQQIAMFLVKNSKEFQQRVTKYKMQGMMFYEAQAKAIGDEIDGAQTVMSKWNNIFVVECVTALKYMYSSIQVHFMDRQFVDENETTTDRKFSEYLKYMIVTSDEEMLADVYGGNDLLSKAISSHEEEFVDYNQFADLIASDEFDSTEVRKFFLHLILRVNKSNIGIFRMYDFAPYARLFVSKSMEERQAEWKKASKIVLITEEEDIAKLDRSVQRLVELERRAEHLYRS